MDSREREYHERQWTEPYRSTEVFCDWLEELGILKLDSEQRILDACCGMGANTYYMAKRYPHCTFVGVDENQPAIGGAYSVIANKPTAPRLFFWPHNAFDLPKPIRKIFNGVICLQTLSWLKQYTEALQNLCLMQVEWIAFSSLFYDGPVSCDITVMENPSTNDFEEGKQQFYNIYSLPVVRKFLENAGYSRVTAKPFEIDIDLPKPDHKLMGTYTRKLDTGERLQQSGPLLMPWYFVLAQKDES